MGCRAAEGPVVHPIKSCQQVKHFVSILRSFHSTYSSMADVTLFSHCTGLALIPAQGYFPLFDIFLFWCQRSKSPLLKFAHH